MSVEKFTLKKKSSNFTQIGNNILQGLKDYEALGLYCYIASLPHNWEFYKKQLSERTNIGRDKINKLLRTLKQCNLIDYVQNKDEKGRFIKLELHVNDGDKFIPIPFDETSNDDEIIHTTENPYPGLIHNTENPLTGKPLTENQLLENSTYKRNNKKEIFKKEREREPVPVDNFVNQAITAPLVTQKPKPSLFSFQPTTLALEAAAAKGVDVRALREKFVRHYSNETEFARNWPELFHNWVDREKVNKGKPKEEATFADVRSQSTSFGHECETAEEAQRKWEERMKEYGLQQFGT